jgi:hypothetical protein
MKQYFGINKDKWKHFFVSAALMIILYPIVKDLRQACWIVFLIGLFKELYDETQVPNGADFWDIVANVVGITSASMVISIMEIFK